MMPMRTISFSNLALVVRYPHLLADIGGFIDLRDEAALMELGGEQRHLCLVHLSVFLFHRLDEQLSDNLLLLRREDDIEDVIRHVKAVK